MNIYKECKTYKEKWIKQGYFDLPDEIPLRLYQLKLAPSYKEIVIKILNNDFNKSENKSKVYSELKKIELIKTKKILEQKKLF